MSTKIAPEVVNVRYTLTTANYIKVEWDTVGQGFLYELNRGTVTNVSTVSAFGITELSADTNTTWDPDPIYITEFDKFYLFDTVTPLRTYNYRIRSVGKDFEPSEWTYAGTVNTFQYNNNSISTQNAFTLADQVITRNLNDTSASNQILFRKKNGDQAVQTAYLMKRGFVFDQYNLNNISQITNEIVTNNKTIVNHGTMPTVCNDDVNRTVPSFLNDKQYAFERWQTTAKVSDDEGRTWYDYSAFPGRLGNPVANNLITQSFTKTYALGFDMIFESKGDEILDFSNIVTEWSSTEATFDFVDNVTPGLPFKAAEFSNVTPLPDLVANKVESYAVGNYLSDEIIVVTANGNIQYYDDVNADVIAVEDDPDNAGLYKFNDEVIRLIEDSNVWDGGATTYPGNPCVRNCIFYNDPNSKNETSFDDVSNGKFFFLYLGDWITDETYTSPRFTQDIGLTQYDADGNLNPYIGVYMLNYHVDYSEFDTATDIGLDPIFIRDPGSATKLTRIYGNTEYERERLDLFSAMSRDEDDLIIKIKNDTLSTEVGQPYRSLIVNPYSGTDPDDPQLVVGTDYVNDQLLIDGNTEITAAVKYFLRPYYTTTVKNNQEIVAFDSSLVMKNKPMDYYDNANAVWMEQEGHRDYKSNNNQHFTMFSEQLKTTPMATTDIRDDELYTVNAVDVTFTNFDTYADGIIIADPYGSIIGYFKFPTSLINYANTIWYPFNTMFTATLINQAVPTPPQAEVEKLYNAPDLLSVYNTLGASEYFEDGLFAQFTKYYVEFLSKGTGTSYNNMYNMMNLHDPLDPLSTEYLYSPFYLNNALPNNDEKEQIMRLFLNRQTDFYSSKGVEDSYKFLFKLLYNEDVEIETESASEFKFIIRVVTDLIDNSIIGKKCRTPTGYGTVTSVSQYFENNVSKYVINLETPTGKFVKGQTVSVDGYNLLNVYPSITVDSSLETSYINNIDADAISKSKSYYTMKIVSKLQYSQYEKDVRRFVHPVGFPFIGITLITVLVNSGISIDSVDTTLEQSLITTFDSGVATKITEYVSDLSLDDERQYTGYYYNEMVVTPNPQYSNLPASYTEQDESDYMLTQAGFADGNVYNIDAGDTLLFGLTPDERRKPYTPSFDSSAYSYSNEYRGPLDALGNIKYPNSILYKWYSEKVVNEDESHIKEIQV